MRKGDELFPSGWDAEEKSKKYEWGWEKVIRSGSIVKKNWIVRRAVDKPLIKPDRKCPQMGLKCV